MKCDTSNNEDEGELFDFDSGDEIPEADRQAPSADGTSGADAGDADENTSPAGNGTGAEPAPEAEPAKLVAPTKVNPYSVIDITPFQEEQPPSPDANTEEEGVGLRVPSGYSVPVPCGYAVPSNLPLLLPAYSSPVIIRAESVEEEGMRPQNFTWRQGTLTEKSVPSLSSPIMVFVCSVGKCVQLFISLK